MMEVLNDSLVKVTGKVDKDTYKVVITRRCKATGRVFGENVAFIDGETLDLWKTQITDGKKQASLPQPESLEK